MRYESESRTRGIAARTISERIRALPEFSEARAIVVAHAVAECRGRDVAGMRELGGFSAVIERHRRELPERYRVDHGSKLLPTTIVDELASDLGRMRAEVQAAICSRALAKQT